LTYHFPSRGLKLRVNLDFVFWKLNFDLPLPLTGIETLGLSGQSSVAPSLTYHFPSRGLKRLLAWLAGWATYLFDLPLPLTGIETPWCVSEPLFVGIFDLPLPLTGIETPYLLLDFGRHVRLWLTTSPHGDWNVRINLKAGP